MIHLLSYIVKEILESSQSMFSLNNDSWKKMASSVALTTIYAVIYWKAMKIK